MTVYEAMLASRTFFLLWVKYSWYLATYNGYGQGFAFPILFWRYSNLQERSSEVQIYQQWGKQYNSKKDKIKIEILYII